MSARRTYRSLFCAGCENGYSGNYAQDKLYRHCRERHPEFKGRVTRWGLEGSDPVDAVLSSAVDLGNLKCNKSSPTRSGTWAPSANRSAQKHRYQKIFGIPSWVLNPAS